MPGESSLKQLVAPRFVVKHVVRPGARRAYSGVTLNVRTIRMLRAAGHRISASCMLDPTKGSYTGPDSSSKATHAGGGAVDLSVRTLCGKRPRGVVRQLRKVGLRGLVPQLDRQRAHPRRRDLRPGDGDRNRVPGLVRHARAGRRLRTGQGRHERCRRRRDDRIRSPPGRATSAGTGPRAQRPAPDRSALLREGPGALAGVLGREHRAGDRARALPVGVLVGDEDPLRRVDRQRAVAWRSSAASSRARASASPGSVSRDTIPSS